ncbi:MAG: hypothetical protein AW07_00798 [Candidatus Accumulibacter sp. SK-11]|nr:MAG: hypothetical protein AW07_00798 [Candidatus Accumulibacter sp. SK-11]
MSDRLLADGGGVGHVLFIAFVVTGGVNWHWLAR